MTIRSFIESGKDHPDAVFSSTESPITVNDIPLTDTQVTDFRKILIKTIDSDLSLKPKCNCGVTEAPLYSEEVCPSCGGVPTRNIGGDIKPVVFLRRPHGVGPLIQYNVWNMMRELFKRGPKLRSNSLLLWITDPNYKLTLPDAKAIAASWEAEGLKRGYNNFVENLEHYLEVMSSHPSIRTKANRDPLLALIKKNKQIIFTNHLSFMDSVTRILERSGANSYAVSGFTESIDAILGVVAIDSTSYSDEKRESMTARFMERYTQYFDKFLDDTVKGGEGLIRGTLYSSRGTRITRLVVNSITEPHDLERIRIPWIAMIYTLESPITVVLLNRGLTLNQVRMFLQYCANNYNKTMHDILNKLVKDTQIGIKATFQRYPTLKRGSMLWMDASDFKIDPTDRAVSLSALAIRSLNLDYDGDMAHVQIFVDKIMDKIMRPLRFHNNCLDNSLPRKAVNVELTESHACNHLSWYEFADELDPSQEEIDKMLSLVGI